jgi:RNA polymerase sigma factor
MIMDEVQLQQLLQNAQNGDRTSREKILRHFKSFVLNVASRVTKRYLTWSDDESSIGLSALNKAIDHYNHKQGKNFLNYSYLIISREIIDFFRREKRHKHRSLQEEFHLKDCSDPMDETPYERQEAERRFAIAESQAEMIQEILIYQSELDKYGIQFDELPECAPKHRDTRENCINLARTLVEDATLTDRMKKKKRLPITELSRASGIPSKTIEKHRKYILSVAILLLHPDLKQLNSYIQKGGDGS